MVKRLAPFTFCLLLVAASGNNKETVAFLKGNHIFVGDLDGKTARQVDSDEREKVMLRVDKRREKLSYLVKRLNGEMARIAVVDLTGKIVAEVPIRPVTDPPVSGMRFVEDLEWLENGKIRIGGSINPSNCEMFDLDVITEKESNWQFGKCGYFVPSPDGKHIAELGLVNQFTDEERRFDHVDIDTKGIDDHSFYWGGDGHEIFIPAGPVWSPDSQYIAILEKRAATGEAAVVILNLARVPTRIPLPFSVLDSPAIEWIGTKIVVGQGATAIQIDSVSNQISGIYSDVGDELKRRSAALRKIKDEKTRIENFVRQEKVREAVFLTQDAANGKQQ